MGNLLEKMYKEVAEMKKDLANVKNESSKSVLSYAISKREATIREIESKN